VWRIAPLRGRVRRALERLSPDKRAAVFEAFESIERNAYYDVDRPKAISHMKGEWLCHREFRALPQAMRIIYSVRDAEREIEVKYIGLHP